MANVIDYGIAGRGLGIYLLDAEGQVIRALGMGPFHTLESAALLQGQPLGATIGGDLGATIVSAVGAGVATWPPEGIVATGYSGDESACAVELVANPYADRDGVAAIGVVWDLSMTVAVAAEWAAAQPFAAIGQSTVRASNQLNNTLQSFVSLVDLLQTPGQGREAATRHLETLSRAAADATALLASLTTPPEGAAEETPPSGTPTTLYLADAMRQTVETHGLTLAPTGLRVVWREATDFRQPIIANPTMLQRALRHVLEEAVASVIDPLSGATRRPEGEPPSFDIHAHPSGTHVTFALTQARRAANQPHAPAVNPAGLGSARGIQVARALIRSMGGDLAIDNASALCIRLSMPFANPAAAMQQLAAVRGVMPRTEPTIFEVRPVARAVTQAPLATMERARALVGRGILLVDDDDTFRYSTRELLRVYGAKVYEAPSGLLAISMITEDSAAFDIILLDRRMPDVRGEQVFRSMMEIAPELRERIIFMSGDRLALHRDFAAFIEAEGLSCIEKPVAPTELVGLLGSFLDRLQPA